MNVVFSGKNNLFCVEGKEEQFTLDIDIVFQVLVYGPPFSSTITLIDYKFSIKFPPSFAAFIIFIVQAFVMLTILITTSHQMHVLPYAVSLK